MDQDGKENKEKQQQTQQNEKKQCTSKNLKGEKKGKDKVQIGGKREIENKKLDANVSSEDKRRK